MDAGTHRSPFLRSDSTGYADRLADATVTVLRISGAPAVGLTSVARAMGVTPSALAHRFEGGEVAPRHRVLMLSTVVFCDRWLAWSMSGARELDPRTRAVPLRLPRDDEERFGVRAWHAFHELARTAALEGETDAAAALAANRTQELAAVRNALDRCVAERRTPAGEPAPATWVPPWRTSAERPDHGPLLALLDGLRWGLAHGTIPYPVAVSTAHDALLRVLDQAPERPPPAP